MKSKFLVRFNTRLRRWKIIMLSLPTTKEPGGTSLPHLPQKSILRYLLIQQKCGKRSLHQAITYKIGKET